MFRKSLDAVKDAVPLADYAAEHVELERAGSGRLAGRCPLHQERTPSFYIYPDGHFHCFGCQAHGDVIDLCQHIEGGGPWEAMMLLATRYNVELPSRPDRWHEWQDEKGRRRRMIRDALADSYQRRLFRVFGGHLANIQDPEEYATEALRYFEGLRGVAVSCAANRMRGDDA